MSYMCRNFLDCEEDCSTNDPNYTPTTARPRERRTTQTSKKKQQSGGGTKRCSVHQTTNHAGSLKGYQNDYQVVPVFPINVKTKRTALQHETCMYPSVPKRKAIAKCSPKHTNRHFRRISGTQKRQHIQYTPDRSRAEPPGSPTCT